VSRNGCSAILVIEGDLGLRSSLVESLRGEGYKVRACDNHVATDLPDVLPRLIILSTTVDHFVRLARAKYPGVPKSRSWAIARAG